MLEQFLEWKANAKPGDKFVYYTGPGLSFEIDKKSNAGPECDELKIIRRAAWDAHLSGKYDLVQRRHPLSLTYGIYDYEIRCRQKIELGRRDIAPEGKERNKKPSPELVTA